MNNLKSLSASFALVLAAKVAEMGQEEAKGTVCRNEHKNCAKPSKRTSQEELEIVEIPAMLNYSSWI